MIAGMYTGEGVGGGGGGGQTGVPPQLALTQEAVIAFPI